jgi:hypothetical protein
VLDSARHQEIVFKSTGAEAAGQGRWTLRGNLTLRGQARPVTVHVTLKDGRYTGAATVKQTDFGSKPPGKASVRAKDASIVHVQSIDNISTPQLIGRFAKARSREYQKLIRQLQQFSALPPQKQAAGRLSRLRSRFQEIVEVEFFDTSLQKRVGGLLSRADGAPEATRMPVFAAIRPRDYKGRVWVTRPRPGVDRSASAWLIRAFIDAKARFAFAAEERVPREAVPFDMFHERGFGHRGDDCTFETLQKQFRILDRRVSVISEIIHDADLADGKFGRKEGYGIDDVLKGWARQGLSDQELLGRGMQLMEGLYHSLP